MAENNSTTVEDKETLIKVKALQAINYEMNIILVKQLERVLTIAENQGVKSASKLIKIFRHCLWEWQQFGKLPSEEAIKILMTLR